MPRFVVLVAVALLATGCSVGGDDAGNDGSSAGFTPRPTPSGFTAGVDSCDLLSADQLAELAGTEVGEAEPALMGGLPVCKWPISESRYIRVGSLPAPDWAQGVPQVLQVMEDKGLVKDKELLDEVRALFDASDVLTPTEACQAFSAILELQGQPAGTQIAINLAPSKEAPHGVSGQMCSVGRFTTVQIADTREVLAKPYPVERVATALKLAHRSSMQ